MSAHDPHSEETGSSEEEALEAGELALLAYLDGELSGEDLAVFEAKMASDANVRRRVRALSAIGRFLREDADRVYTAAKVDGIAETVMSRLDAVRPVEAIEAKGDTDVAVTGVTPEPANDTRISEVHPATSRAARRGKSTVVWIAFGSVAAAAAALLVFLSSNPMPPPATAPVASAPVSASPTETIAAVKPVIPPGPPAPVPEHASALEIDNLEIGEGASVIYTQDGASTIWLTDHHEGPK